MDNRFEWVVSKNIQFPELPKKKFSFQVNEFIFIYWNVSIELPVYKHWMYWLENPVVALVGTSSYKWKFKSILKWINFDTDVFWTISGAFRQL